METIMKYKGVELKKNDFMGYLYGEGKYAVYSGNIRFPFDSKKDFKDAVNGFSEKGWDCVSYVDESGRWGHIPIGEFKTFILS